MPTHAEYYGVHAANRCVAALEDVCRQLTHRRTYRSGIRMRTGHQSFPVYAFMQWLIYDATQGSREQSIAGISHSQIFHKQQTPEGRQYFNKPYCSSRAPHHSRLVRTSSLETKQSGAMYACNREWGLYYLELNVRRAVFVWAPVAKYQTMRRMLSITKTWTVDATMCLPTHHKVVIKLCMLAVGLFVHGAAARTRAEKGTTPHRVIRCVYTSDAIPLHVEGHIPFLTNDE